MKTPPTSDVAERCDTMNREAAFPEIHSEIHVGSAIDAFAEIKCPAVHHGDEGNDPKGSPVSA
jgi:hypothetical protein